MSAVFFNTTGLRSRELAAAVAAAKCQDAAVLALFVTASGPMSPSQVREQCARMGRDWPVTSIRRSITTLSDRNLLVRTDDKVRGPYGAVEHLWRIA
jgi:hypothetical protein